MLVFNKDDGKSVEGSCDNANVRHKVVGTYDNPANISITITRTGQDGCVTNAHGYIKVVNSDSIEFGQSGWNGCGVTTNSVTRLFSRS